MTDRRAASKKIPFGLQIVVRIDPATGLIVSFSTGNGRFVDGLEFEGGTGAPSRALLRYLQRGSL